MALSGTTNFSQTRDQIINLAFSKIGVYGIGRTPSPEDYSLAVANLNAIIKFWGAKGLHLWCKEEAVLYVTKYQAKYGFGNSSSINLAPAYSCQRAFTSTAQITSNVSNGAITIPISSSGHMAIGDNIGIVLSDNSLFWTTISSVSATQVVLNSGITNNSITGNLVYSFPVNKLLNKPYRIIGARYVSGFDSGQTSTINEIIMSPLSHSDYQNLPSKSNNGPVNQYNYDPQTDYGVINLWSRPDNCNCRVHFTYERIMDDVNSAGDNFDLPQEWYLPLYMSLAVILAPDFGKEAKLKALAPIATQALNDLLDFDKEFTGISFQPDHHGGGVY